MYMLKNYACSCPYINCSSSFWLDPLYFTINLTNAYVYRNR